MTPRPLYAFQPNRIENNRKQHFSLTLNTPFLNLVSSYKMVFLKKYQLIFNKTKYYLITVFLIMALHTTNDRFLLSSFIITKT